MTDRMQQLEETLAHLTRQIEELSDVVTMQSQQIDRLDRRVALLMRAEAQRAEDAGAAVIVGDERPPHW